MLPSRPMPYTIATRTKMAQGAMINGIAALIEIADARTTTNVM